MDSLADELRRQFTSRLANLNRLLRELVGQLPPAPTRARQALGLYEQYCKAVVVAVDDQWNNANDAEDRIAMLRFHLRDLNDRASELEDWFSHSNSDVVPPTLVDAVEREITELFGSPRQVVLAIGSADNYETLISELQDVVFGALGSYRPSLEEQLRDTRFALIRVPRLEAGEPSWRPIVLGHEIAHLALAERSTIADFDFQSKVDPTRAVALGIPPHLNNLRSNPTLALKTVAEQWIEELLCDAYACRRFGPAAIAALAGFFEFVGAMDDIGDHPPGWVRCRMLIHWLRGTYSPALEKIIAPWSELVDSGPPEMMPDWARYVTEILWDHRDLFPALLENWPEAYEIGHRTAIVEWLARELNDGVARADCLGFEEGTQSLTDADIVNAAWVARDLSTGMPVDQLADKSLESLDFLRRWEDAGGETPEWNEIEAFPGVSSRGLVSEREISRRLRSTDPGERLVVSPSRLSVLKGASLDIRLGKHFIVFERSSTPAFASYRGEARRMQSAVEKSWGDVFVLHPGELVLASTLEYLVLPTDLAATVVTRSSYGRMGLLSATAVLVHPNYRGCLTLELINLGRVPLELQPGERIAQLAFQVVDPAVEPVENEDKYQCNTKPEFSRVANDREANVLQALSKHGQGT